MPFTANQFETIGYTSIEFFKKNEPIDQVNWDHPFFSKLVKNKMEDPGGQEFLNEQIYIANDSNGQNYFGSDLVTYNERDNIRQAKYPWYNYHNGFGFDEDTLKANGLIVTDDREAEASNAEKVMLNNRLKIAYQSMKKGTVEDLDFEFHLDGSQDTKAVPGLDHLVSTTPTVGVVGGIDAATSAFWQNNTSLNISTAAPEDGTINAAMKAMYRANALYGSGGKRSDLIICGQSFIEALEAENRKINTVFVQTNGTTGVDLDGAVARTYFDGIPVIWDPTFDLIDARYGSFDIPWTKRCYMLSSDTIKLRPVSGYWMLTRKPRRMPDRYLHFWAQTCSYRMTINQRNANAVLSIA